MNGTDWREQIALNAICPYFTMFPLEFPLAVIKERAGQDEAVLDPFCGRGTTNFAARLLGLPTLGVDSSQVAVAATSAKLVGAVDADQIVQEAQKILSGRGRPSLPNGKFWKLAYKPNVLQSICKVRQALLENCRSDKRKALRGIMLGALHGPLRKSGGSSYFSNQCPRTYAPKPRYAVSYWRESGFQAPDIDVLEIIESRAFRYYGRILPSVGHRVVRGDSRNLSSLRAVCTSRRPRLIVTSPPYYGLRTYVADQWLRNWFLGGPAQVDYSYGIQLSHLGIQQFTNDLSQVWRNVAKVSSKSAQLIFRFGAINDRRVIPQEIIRNSLNNTPWRLTTIVNAGTAQLGKRQADNFVSSLPKPLVEFDAWARRA